MAGHLVPDPVSSSGQLSEPPPPVLTSSATGSFAWGVLHRRHPALIEQARDAHPYQPAQHQALDRLLDEITAGTVQMLPPEAHDYSAWQVWGDGHFGRPWDEVPFLWAESYFYRRLLDAVGFFTPGAWYWLDPFEHLKAAELRDPALELDLARLDRLADLSTHERGQAALLAALWGNRADLGFAMSAAASGPEVPDTETDLVADDTSQIWSELSAGGATVCLVADNAGRELLGDLVLIDHLIETGLADQVVLHVKPSPYYVSDATTPDVVACLRRLAATPGYAADTAQRLHSAYRDGRVSVDTHWFYCSPLTFHHAPPELMSAFESASLTIMKGDLNYRRLVGDCAWEPTTAFSATTAYLPGAVATLRTLKSDVVVGLAPATLASLDATDRAWRTNGTHALVQARL